jgi:hypothetical protein
MSNFDGLMKNDVSVTLPSYYTLIALKLHNNCSYIIVIELHKLHMYMVSHTLNSSITTHAIVR